MEFMAETVENDQIWLGKPARSSGPDVTTANSAVIRAYVGHSRHLDSARRLRDFRRGG